MSFGVGSIPGVVLSTWIACSGAALAQETMEVDRQAIEVHIGAVIASNTGQAFDQRLTSLRGPFDSLFRYTSYRLIREERRRVEWKREAGFELPGRRYLLVIPRGYKDGRVLLNLMLMQGRRPLLNTGIALRNHGTFLLGGPHHEDGVLIVSIGAGTVR